MSTQQTNGEPDSVPHSRYESTNRKSYSTQQDVADAWAEGKYPTHNVGNGQRTPDGAVLYTGSPRNRRAVDGQGTNFHGVQHPDGSGTLWHYSTREAIRTHNGLIISNHQCWSAGFAHCSTPDEIDASVPLSAVEEFLDDGDTVYDIVEVVGQPTTEKSSHSDRVLTYHRARNSVVVLESGYGVAIGRDRSVKSADSHFAFRLDPSEVEKARENGPADTIRDALLPDAVAASDLPVVDSSEYTETRLSDEEAEAHEAAGGNLTKIEGGRYRDDYRGNLQHFRADLRGEAIIRQGEWFFIPEPDADPQDVGARYAQEQLGNHRAQRFHGARSPTPKRCGECGGTKWHIESENPRFGREYDARYVCKNCKTEADRGIYIRGQVRHTSNDHDAVNLGDVWHRAVTHGRDVLTYDDHPSGGRGGGGFD